MFKHFMVETHVPIDRDFRQQKEEEHEQVPTRRQRWWWLHGGGGGGGGGSVGGSVGGCTDGRSVNPLDMAGALRPRPAACPLPAARPTLLRTTQCTRVTDTLCVPCSLRVTCMRAPPPCSRMTAKETGPLPPSRVCTSCTLARTRRCLRHRKARVPLFLWQVVVVVVVAAAAAAAAAAVVAVRCSFPTKPAGGSKQRMCSWCLKS
jgi:hypothetical protein